MSLPVLPELNTAKRNKIVLYGIRHGTSTGNEWMQKEGNRWGDEGFQDNPELADARLSQQGVQQAHNLAESLIQLQLAEGFRKCWLSEIELVVVSPLTRCLQTWQLGVKPALDHLYAEVVREEENNSVSMSLTDKLFPNPPPVIALPLLRERLYTASDTGRCVTVLEEEYPEIDWVEAKRYAEKKSAQGQIHIDDTFRCECSANHSCCWWYTNPAEEPMPSEWRPNGKGQWYAVPGEPNELFERRMMDLEWWLRDRPETCILLVTHWAVLRHWTGEEVSNMRYPQDRILWITQ